MTSRSLTTRPVRLLRNQDEIPVNWLTETLEAAERAVAAGAVRPLTYVGSGMTGTVFTDRYRNTAYKVARHGTARDMIAEEAEWFRAAKRAPEIADLIPAGKYRWDAENGVLIKPYVKGRPGSWGDATKLYGLHSKIEKAMLPRGWTAPERKEDSYVVAGGSEGRDSWRAGDFATAKIVDASMPHRVGRELVKYALDVAVGRRRPQGSDRLADIAYYVYRERIAPNNHGGTIPLDEVRRVLKALRDAGGAFEWVV